MNNYAKWITTSQACDLSGYHPDSVRKLLQSGKIKGRKWGNSWMVDRDSLIAYMDNVAKLGKRRGPKKKSLD